MLSGNGNKLVFAGYAICQRLLISLQDKRFDCKNLGRAPSRIVWRIFSVKNRDIIETQDYDDPYLGDGFVTLEKARQNAEQLSTIPHIDVEILGFSVEKTVAERYWEQLPESSKAEIWEFADESLLPAILEQRYPTPPANLTFLGYDILAFENCTSAILEQLLWMAEYEPNLDYMVKTADLCLTGKEGQKRLGNAGVGDERLSWVVDVLNPYALFDSATEARRFLKRYLEVVGEDAVHEYGEFWSIAEIFAIKQ
ncbi:MAG: hypothetical protein DRP82_00295 [Planctomycetota bacterium]|nr:MAG: hypothetical protein DRP82_00295 [Planctomycetota bacterium]